VLPTPGITQQFILRRIFNPDEMEFVRTYYSYILRIATNIELFEAIKIGVFPQSEISQSIELSKILLWLCKI
jgi:hypothetical protein